MLRVDNERCTGCAACLDVCPTGAIQLVDKIAVIHMDLCQECQACVAACPQGAIQVVGEQLPVLEGEVINVAERQMVVQQPVNVITSPVSRPWLVRLGTALAFVGREIVPRVATSLLDAWERRQVARSSPGRSAADSSLSSDMRGGGHRQRQRQRRGR